MQATTTKIGGRRVVCVIARQKQHVAQLINRSAKQSIGDSGRSLRGPKLNCVGAETHPYQRLVVGFIGNVVFPHFSHLGRAPELGVLRVAGLCSNFQRESGGNVVGLLACCENFCKHGKACVLSTKINKCKCTVQSLSRAYMYPDYHRKPAWQVLPFS